MLHKRDLDTDRGVLKAHATYAHYMYTSPAHSILTSAKRGTRERAVILAVLTVLCRHVLGQMRILSDVVDVCVGEAERIKQTEGKGGLCTLIRSRFVGVQEGDAHFSESCAIPRRANEAEVSEVLQGKFDWIGLRDDIHRV